MLKKKAPAKLPARACATEPGTSQKRREDDICRQIECEQRREKSRPGQGNGEVVGIVQIEARDALFLELVGAEANPRHSVAGLRTLFLREGAELVSGV